MGIEDRLRALAELIFDERKFEDHMAALRRIEETDMNRLVGAAITGSDYGCALRAAAESACRISGHGSDQVDTLLRSVQFTDDLDISALRAYCVGLNHGAGATGHGRSGPVVYNIYSRVDDDPVTRLEIVEALLLLRAGVGGAREPGDMCVLLRDAA